MNNQLFTTLPIEIQEDVKKTLKAYDRASVIFEYGEYHVSVAISLKATYAPDHKVIGEYFAKDLYTDAERIINYMEAFHEYPIEYKGKRDYAMLKELNTENSYIDINGDEHTYPNWDAKFKFDDNGNIVRA